MRLKKIKLAGFKSFVDPTNIPFPHDMTAIVGPNGCGKSNVIDAVRWVLGESSAKNLRGDAMTDVIFNGSSARKPVSQCSVELVFDNTSGRIQGEYASYNELSVKRLVTREAQSFYFLNNQKCRRRDVTDLFLGTGLGPRSYAIIEQGMISRLIESKPHELRVFIEEAAGISKYKERRRETENRIRHTGENLERLDDVRVELGQQLEKLQRQAAAAKRYKDLKQKERTLNGELAAIRWKSFDDKRHQLTCTIEQVEQEIQNVLAGQSNNESKLIDLKVTQQTLQLKLRDIQQSQFNLNTDITRAEQNQIHNKQRSQTLQVELKALDVSLTELKSHLTQDDDALEGLLLQLDEVEQQKEIQSEIELQRHEQLLLVEQIKADAEETWQRQRRQSEQKQLKIVQQQSAERSLEALCQRTQSRVSELALELAELDTPHDDDQLDVIAENIVVLDNTVEEAEIELEEKLTQIAHNDDEIRSMQGLLQQHQNISTDLKAQISALERVIRGKSRISDSKQSWLEQHGTALENIWDWIKAESGWERALEVVLKQWSDGYLVSSEQLTLSDLPISLLIETEFVGEKVQGSLGEKILNEKVPSFCNLIGCDDGVIVAESFVLGRITSDGKWSGLGWRFAQIIDDELSLIELSEQKNALTQHLTTTQSKLSEIAEELNQCQSVNLERQSEKSTIERTLNGLKNQRNELQTQLKIEQNQASLQQDQQQKIEQEISKAKSLFADEQAQLELLKEQNAELGIEYDELVIEEQNLENQLFSAQHKVTDVKQQYEQCKQELTQLSLKHQELMRQRETIQNTQHRSATQLESMMSRQTLLLAELEELIAPLETLEEQMQIWLEQREELTIEQQVTQEALTETENTIATISDEYKVVADKVEAKREELASVKLELEGIKVNAENQLDVLRQMEQNLGTILQSLAADAEENSWQRERDKTTSAISRLGAVNLAAVDEFEAATERKLHLDTQYQDLHDALETLEQAIRKIDRETRGRFKTTFEQVNGDFQHLFPKVFEGGSATLELTGEDLLETGVSIMAQPPGKKNSTIHLLSGGEKALAALSLVFSIFRLNPAPFCLLDEVDAPLDDANVGRFCNLVSEMSNSVQFIYITHNKIAMEMASHLTGVTMAEPGVSRMVAVDVEEAVALAAL